MGRGIETRIVQLEKAAGSGSGLEQLSDAELDVEFVAAEQLLRTLTAKSDYRRLDEELLAGQSTVEGEVNLTYEAMFMPRTFALLKAACIGLGRPHHPDVESTW